MPVIPVVCPVCLSTIVPDDNLSNPGCGHVFHAACIEEWFRVQSNKKCPHCRVSSRGKALPIYLQFDQNALNETMRSTNDGDEVFVISDSSNNDVSNQALQSSLSKVNAEFASYKSRIQEEKASREQTISYLGSQLSRAETELAEKNRQNTVMSRKINDLKDTLSEMQADSIRKEYLVQDLQSQVQSLKIRFDAEVERPCKIRKLLLSKDTEIKEKVATYKEMGEHGIQVLAEFALAADSETRKLKNELRNMRVELDVLKDAHSRQKILSSSNIENMEPERCRGKSGKSLLRRQTSNSSVVSSADLADATLDYTLPISPSSSYEVRLSQDRVDESASNTRPSTSDIGKVTTPETKKESKKKVFVPVDSDNDILMEKTIIESPVFKNPLVKVKGSLLSRKRSVDQNNKQIKTARRNYNGLGYSATPLFRKTSSNV